MRCPQRWIERALGFALVGITFCATTALTGCQEMFGLGRRPPLNMIHGRGVTRSVEDLYAGFDGRASTEGPVCRLNVRVAPDGGEPFEAAVQRNIPYLHVNRSRLWVDGPVEPGAGAIDDAFLGEGGVSL